MLKKELIDRKITNIFALVNYESYGMDSAEVFVELDTSFIIDIPYANSENDKVWIKDLNPQAVSIFKDVSDEVIYHVDRVEKGIGELADQYRQEKKSLIGRVKTFLGIENIIKEYRPYKVEYREYKAKHIQNRTIVDLLWYEDEIEKGFLELDNGYIITETTSAMNGTGRAGLNYFENLDSFVQQRGANFLRLTDTLL